MLLSVDDRVHDTGNKQKKNMNKNVFGNMTAHLLAKLTPAGPH